MMVLLILLSTGISALYQGLIYSYLWDWFVVPFGVIPLGVFQAAGLVIMFSMFKYEHSDGGRSKLEIFKHQLDHLIAITIMWGFCAVFYACM